MKMCTAFTSKKNECSSQFGLVWGRQQISKQGPWGAVCLEAGLNPVCGGYGEGIGVGVLCAQLLYVRHCVCPNVLKERWKANEHPRTLWVFQSWETPVFAWLAAKSVFVLYLQISLLLCFCLSSQRWINRIRDNREILLSQLFICSNTF